MEWVNRAMGKSIRFGYVAFNRNRCLHPAERYVGINGHEHKHKHCVECSADTAWETQSHLFLYTVLFCKKE